MRNWDLRDELGYCNSEAEWKAVQSACKKLNVPCSQVNLTKEYWNFVFDPFINQLENGATPNPDVSCNKYIKFGSFIQKCMQLYQPEKIAFGHYANIKMHNGKLHLANALDTTKDQTYYLSNIHGNILEKILFPVGNLLKRSVKQIALDNDLTEFAEKKESMGICFIGKRKFASFIGTNFGNLW
jgi:tRNA-specific 2-thiouridylase